MKKIATLALSVCVICSSAPAFAAGIQAGVKAEGGKQGVGIHGGVQVKGTQGTQGAHAKKGTAGTRATTPAKQPGTTTGQPAMPKTGAGGASDTE
ncbi:hypothetical protein PP175_10745 [Aneurinibacillus sp. Ricciae_BoGa-3]|uniref:hypothetical protein n=1 Tax=Aneurinibacillus sp. Ricciae_BoGa-3 TaxID=3022697 RepID=UPI0023410081|nr:hypothetical protein [Aneurinibacillus sp. Ricciae_BoGa-3]WCK56345.1 hypothetical protein PP175_10745 [Aneurinibacillus sp. Ricciae_BoGa-3]